MAFADQNLIASAQKFVNDVFEPRAIKHQARAHEPTRDGMATTKITIPFKIWYGDPYQPDDEDRIFYVEQYQIDVPTEVPPPTTAIQLAIYNKCMARFLSANLYFVCQSRCAICRMYNTELASVVDLQYRGDRYEPSEMRCYGLGVCKYDGNCFLLAQALAASAMSNVVARQGKSNLDITDESGVGGELVIDGDEGMGCVGCGQEEGVYACEGCGVVRYCSRECDEDDWERHKPLCQDLQMMDLEIKTSIDESPASSKRERSDSNSTSNTSDDEHNVKKSRRETV
ncbi:hypothetical protein BJ878DRAFT_545780 [Calycina marina]|uniref:MYND-type domain-containing protein n=1 Tax=Calycina marina TaxID=1763456 RepID=A0A9P7YVU3_9HELO|nr:hypothetical protein BJ878DRAFT_545780 [Calycina marina]